MFYKHVMGIVLGMCWKWFGCVLGVFWKCFGGVFGVFSWISWGSVGSILGSFWGCFGVVLWVVGGRVDIKQVRHRHFGIERKPFLSRA